MIFFSPVAAQPPELFFKAAGGTVTISIDRINDAVEPASQNDSGQTGAFSVSVSELLGEDLTVAYAVSGIASNGQDYANLTGTLVIPSNSFSGSLLVEPSFDNFLEFDESVVVTLLPGSGYVVATNHSKASIFIEDNLGTNRIFDVVATNLNSPVGIDYHPITNALIVSVDSSGVGGFDFVRLGTNGPAGFFTNWSGVSLANAEEKKVAIVQTTGASLTNAAGFTNGSLFFGTGSDGVIGVISPGGGASNLSWALLGAGRFRGGLYVDRSGSFDGDLIAVTSSSGLPDLSETVWQLKPSGESNRLASIPAGNSHLEGVITLTNDWKSWGPWAGKVITGNEDGHKIFAVDTNGVSEFILGVDPEDFDLIPTNQDLYCAEVQTGQILRLSQSLLTSHIGDLLITQSGETAPALKSQLFIAHWDGTDFLMTRITFAHTNGGAGHFEHSTFAPISLPTLAQPQ